MLSTTVISRAPTTGAQLLNHIVAGGTFSAAPTVVGDGFKIRNQAGNSFDALEFTFSFDATAAADTEGQVRPWFWVPDHDPAAAGGMWLAGKISEGLSISTASSDIQSPVRRINAVPVAATRLYLQVVTINGTAPANLYMVAYGVVGFVADVSLQDLQVDIEVSGLTLGAVKLEDGASANRALIRDADVAANLADHVLVTQTQDAAGGIQPAGDVNTSALFTQLTDGADDLGLETANTAGAVGTIVVPTKVLDETGKASPAGDTVGNAPFTALTDGTNTAAIDPANTARTTATVVQATQLVGADGQATPSGADADAAINMRLLGLMGTMSGPGIYVSPVQFTAVYQAPTGIDLAGHPTVTDVSQFVMVVQISNVGIMTVHYPHVSTGAFSWSAANNRLSVAGAAFAATDIFGVVLRGADRYADEPGNFLMTGEVNPYELTGDDAGIETIAALQAFTNAWVDMGSPIPMVGKGGVSVFLDVDINDDSNLRIRALGTYEVGGTEYPLSIASPGAAAVAVEAGYIELTADIDQNIPVEFVTSGKFITVQLQIMRGTDGLGVDAEIDSCHHIRSALLGGE